VEQSRDVSCPWSHTAVRATRRVRSAVAEVVKASRRRWESKELTDLTGSNCDILSPKAEPHPVMIRVNPNRGIEDSDPLLNISAADSQKGLKARQIGEMLSHPFPKGRAGCIAYVCQDLFPHIC
jgi:hypothetical protein